jgi:hypothetical protein
LGFALFGLLLTGCSDDCTCDCGQDSCVDVAADAGDDADATIEDGQLDAEEDIPTIGEVGNPDQGGDGCDPSILANAWPWNDAVTTGSVTVDESDGVFTATIDAAAGGMNASRSRPFVYIDLETGARVDITDLESLESTAWDLAFKRVLIRTNSADSGPGQISLAKVSGTTFDDVTSAPTSSSAYATDVSLDEECELLTDPIGNPIAAINYVNTDNPTGSASWYDYTGGIAPHSGDIYIVRDDADGTTYNLEIGSWTSGVYEIRWAEL